MIAKKRYRRDKLPATSLNRKRIFISYRFGVAYPVYSGSDERLQKRAGWEEYPALPEVTQNGVSDTGIVWRAANHDFQRFA